MASTAHPADLRAASPPGAPPVTTKTPELLGTAMEGDAMHPADGAARAAWSPPIRWVPLPEAAQYLGTTPGALRKYVERAERDDRGRVKLQGESLAEKRGRLWFVRFPG